MISVSNGNHMLNANTTSSMSAPSGSCDAAPPTPPSLPTHTGTHTLSTPPPATSDVASFVSHGVSSSAQSALLFHVHVAFCFPHFFFFFVPAVVPSFTQTLSDLAGILVTVPCPLHFVSIPYLMQP